METNNYLSKNFRWPALGVGRADPLAGAVHRLLQDPLALCSSRKQQLLRTATRYREHLFSPLSPSLLPIAEALTILITAIVTTPIESSSLVLVN